MGHTKKCKTINIYKMSNKRCFKNDQRLIQMGCKTDKKKKRTNSQKQRQKSQDCHRVTPMASNKF